MDTYAEIARAIRAITGGNGGTALFTAEVKSVEGETCTVLVGELEVPDVLLTPADEGAKGKLVITPKVGSQVTVADLSGGELRHLAVVHWGEVEKISLTADSIELNGGENGGMVNIKELTQKLNALVQAFNAHTHTVTGSGTMTPTGAIAVAANATPVANPAQTFNTRDYEDTKITH